MFGGRVETSVSRLLPPIRLPRDSRLLSIPITALLLFPPPPTRWSTPAQLPPYSLTTLLAFEPRPSFFFLLFRQFRDFILLHSEVSLSPTSSERSNCTWARNAFQTHPAICPFLLPLSREAEESADSSFLALERTSRSPLLNLAKPDGFPPPDLIPLFVCVARGPLPLFLASMKSPELSCSSPRSQRHS